MKRIKIGPHTFKIEYGKGLGVDDNFGKADMESLTIFIRDDVPESLQRETLVHECLHLIRELSGIERTDPIQEEKEVQIMGMMLMEVIDQLNEKSRNN
jgi:hypothetical protein